MISPFATNLRTKLVTWFVTRTLPKNWSTSPIVDLRNDLAHLDVGDVARLRVVVGIGLRHDRDACTRSSSSTRYCSPMCR